MLSCHLIQGQQAQKTYRGVEQGSARWAHNPKVGGSNPSPAIFFGGIAQLVEQRNHNPRVAGSSPAAAITLLFPIESKDPNLVSLVLKIGESGVTQYI